MNNSAADFCKFRHGRDWRGAERVVDGTVPEALEGRASNNGGECRNPGKPTQNA